jgi:hypothetical protein
LSASSVRYFTRFAACNVAERPLRITNFPLVELVGGTFFAYKTTLFLSTNFYAAQWRTVTAPPYPIEVLFFVLVNHFCLAFQT